jgi:hypothetical protein
MTDLDLELELRDLAAHLDVPPTPSLSSAVLARLTRRRRQRRRLSFAVAVGIAALAVALAVPGSRAALLRFFHLRGASVSVVDSLPPLTAHRPLGQPIALDQASFRLLLTSGRHPEHVYAGDGGYWLRYRGLLLFEFQSSPGTQILKKVAGARTDVEYVHVDRDPGIWIGALHGLYLPGGAPVAAGHTLIWQHGPLTLRLEAAVGLDRALAIARSVR